MKTKPFIRSGLFLMAFSVLFLNCGGDEDSKKNSMNIIAIDPDSPASLKFNEFVVITYEYNIENMDGARMWIIPFTNGDRSPEYLYSSSKVYTGSGTRQVGISIESGTDPVVVDQLKISMVDPDQTETYIERFVNVDYEFSN